MSKQTKFWAGKFGDDYIDRNPLDIATINKSYKIGYGKTRFEMNEQFIGKLNKNIKILEVGANWGGQLLLLSRMGFRNLYGIDINEKAINIAKGIRPITIINGEASNIPFKDNYFDLVFTSGVLIHIPPKNILNVLSEIYRCSNKYIWGFEYFSDVHLPIEYRGFNKLLWKGDFCKMYEKSFDNLKVIKRSIYSYIDNSNIDLMFLLKKY